MRYVFKIECIHHLIRSAFLLWVYSVAPGAGCPLLVSTGNGWRGQPGSPASTGPSSSFPSSLLSRSQFKTLTFFQVHTFFVFQY